MGQTNSIAAAPWIVQDWISKFRMNAKTVHTLTGSDIDGLWPSFSNLYPMDGDTTDSVGANDLTQNGSPTFAEGGPFGQYIVLDGAADYLTAANNGVYDVTTEDFWMAGAFYRTSDSGAEEHIISKQDLGSEANPGYLVKIDSSDQLAFRIDDGPSASTTVTLSTTLSINTWYFWAVSADRSGNATVYLYNLSTGTLSSTSEDITIHSGTLTNTQTFTVARDSKGSVRFFPGRMDMIIPPQLNATLSQTQFLALVGAMRPAMIVRCSETGSGFTKDRLYQRNIEGTDWVEIVETDATQTLNAKTLETSTFNLTDNTLEDDSDAQGDIVKHDGTSFKRFAMGSSDQILKVNNGATDLEYGDTFVEIARTTQGSNAQTMTLSSIPTKKYLKIIIAVESADTQSIFALDLRVNNDSGSNYNYRTSSNGGSDATSSSDTEIDLGSVSTGSAASSRFYAVIEIDNSSASDRKRGIIHTAFNTPTAGVPDREEIVFEWDNTSNQITRIDVISGASNEIATGSEIIAYGSD